MNLDNARYYKTTLTIQLDIYQEINDILCRESDAERLACNIVENALSYSYEIDSVNILRGETLEISRSSYYDE